MYPRVSAYALMLAAAGIPLYIHLPRFAATELGLSLATVGAVLLAIRVVDFVQDPALGWMVDRFPQYQMAFAMSVPIGLAAGFATLYSLSASDGIVLQLGAVLVLLFTAYSLGMILLYGRSTALAQSGDTAAQLKIAGYREAGMLGGVILAAIAPTLLSPAPDAINYARFGVFLAVVAIAAGVFARPIWRGSVQVGAAISLSSLRGSGAGRLLLVALINSLPVAITSTLFLFFVEDRLMLRGQAGPLLLLFFLGAGLSVPIWTRLARRVGPRETLLLAMPLAIAGFVGAAFLPAGALVPFAVICVVSGAALGADMVVLPAMFLIALDRAGLAASMAYGLWSLAGKLSLALAAALCLPYLQASGFEAGGVNSADALTRLNLSYAVLPCILKLGALAMVLTLPTKEATV